MDQPGPPDGTTDVEDVVSLQKTATPESQGTFEIPYQVTVKFNPRPEEYEMYNVTDDPMELHNLYNNPTYSSQQNQLAQLLQQQRCAKRLTPSSGNVPGQPTCQS